MNADFMRESEEWYREGQFYVDGLPDGKFKEGLKAAALRNKADIARIGLKAHLANFFADNERKLRKAENEENVKYLNCLLKKAENEELAEAEHKTLMSADKDTRAAYIRVLQVKSGVGKRFFGKTFDNFEADGKNDEALTACIEIAQRQRKKGLILSGDTGIGKSHLGSAVVNHFTEQGRFATFAEARKIIGRIQDSFKTIGTEKAIKKLLDDCEILVVDDLGTEYSREGSTWTKDLFYAIVDQADLDEKILIITTNLSAGDIRQRYGARTYSRLVEMCDYMEYTGKDRRFEPTDEKTPWS